MLIQTAAHLLPEVVDVLFFLLIRLVLIDVGSGVKKTSCGVIFL